MRWLFFPTTLFAPSFYSAHPKPIAEAVFLEEPSLFYDPIWRPCRVNRNKIAFFRASMKAYAAYWESQGIPVSYIPYQEAMTYMPSFFQGTVAWDPCDHILRQKYSPHVHFLSQAPNFILDQKELANIDTHRMPAIYKACKAKLDFLVHIPSHDMQNRHSLPKDHPIPPKPTYHLLPETAAFYEEAILYAQKPLFDRHVGDPTYLKYSPITHEASARHLDFFIAQRFASFGPFQDAIVPDETHLFHAFISHLLNVGLLTPLQVIARIRPLQGEIPMASYEGFVRQILGWREYMRYLYLQKTAWIMEPFECKKTGQKKNKKDASYKNPGVSLLASPDAVSLLSPGKTERRLFDPHLCQDHTNETCPFFSLTSQIASSGSGSQAMSEIDPNPPSFSPMNLANFSEKQQSEKKDRHAADGLNQKMNPPSGGIHTTAVANQPINLPLEGMDAKALAVQELSLSTPLGGMDAIAVTHQQVNAPLERNTIIVADQQILVSFDLGHGVDVHQDSGAFDLTATWDTQGSLAFLDHEIHKAQTWGYAHHIIRLMVFLNLFRLMEIPPRAIYRWFMEVVSLDAYDWVMYPNIAAMGFYTQVPLMHKPYISTSAYYAKLSGNPRRCGLWDALFYCFLERNETRLTGGAAIYGRNLATFKKFDPAIQEAMRQKANAFLESLRTRDLLSYFK